RRRGKTESNRLRKLAHFSVEPGFDLLELLCLGFPVAPFFHADPSEAGVARADQTQQAEARDGGDMLHARYSGGYYLQFGHDLLRALERSGIGELDIDVEVALILIRNETDRKSATDPEA